MLPFAPRAVEGFGTLRLGGRLDEAFIASGELSVERAKVLALPLSELRIPVEIDLAPATGSGTIKVRRWSARLAGGHFHGDAQFHIGAERPFSGDLNINDLDLETLTRLKTDWNKPASGKIGGRITWAGLNPSPLRGLRGKVNLNLTDASLFELPVFKEIGRFLGAANGGIFEQGELNATLTERRMVVDQLTLAGELVQMHATGTVGYNSQLDLEVVVNTNQIISQSGQALVGIIPGLRDVLGRREQAMRQVNGFLSNRLVKLRVTGTISQPIVNTDASVLVTEGALNFFVGVFKIPLGLVR